MNDDDFYEDNEFRISHRRGASNPGNPNAIASIVIGTVSIFLLWLKFIVIFLGVFFIPLNIIGILLARSAAKKNEATGYSTGLATIGLVVNIVSLILYILGFVLLTAVATFIFNLF